MNLIVKIPMIVRPAIRALATLVLVAPLLGCDASILESSNVRETASPAGSNSQSPRLSQDINGNPLLSWIETEGAASMLKYSVLSQGQWSQPREVSRGNSWMVNGADRPSVVQLTDALFAAHWLVKNPASAFAYDIFTSHSLTEGRSWSKPIMPYTGVKPGEYGFVSLYHSADEFGDAYGVVWLDGRNVGDQISADERHDQAGVALRSVQIGLDGSLKEQTIIDNLVCDCCPTSLTQGPLGPIVAYRNRDESEQRDIFFSRLTEGQWSTPLPVGFDDWHINGCPVNGPVIVSQGAVVAAAWFTAAGGRKSIRLALSRDGGQTFGQSTEVDHGPVIGRVDLAIDRANHIVVSWLAVPEDSEYAEIRLQAYVVGDVSLEREASDSITLKTKRPRGIPVIASLSDDASILVWTSGSVMAPKVAVKIWGY